MMVGFDSLRGGNQNYHSNGSFVPSIVREIVPDGVIAAIIKDDWYDRINKFPR